MPPAVFTSCDLYCFVDPQAMIRLDPELPSALKVVSFIYVLAHLASASRFHISLIS